MRKFKVKNLGSLNGCTTQILAPDPQVDSPDNCQDEENLLDDLNRRNGYGTPHSFQSNHANTTITVMTELSLDTLANDIKTITADSKALDTKFTQPEHLVGHIEHLYQNPCSEEVIEYMSEKFNELCIKEPKFKETCPESEKVEINHNLHVSIKKLNTLLSHLEVDKMFPNQDKDCEDDDLQPFKRKFSSQERPKLGNCLFLKNGRKPQVTAEGRKVVRFADVLGLDLFVVKIFSDEIPDIPKAAFDNLDINLPDENFDFNLPEDYVSSYDAKKTFQPAYSKVAPTKSLVPMFNQPGDHPQFLETVLAKKVSLEYAFMDGPSTVFGVVRVLNISFYKSVVVKWTVNNWSSASETACKYVESNSSSNTDKFSFLLLAANLPVGGTLQFCLKFDCDGEHWDNNWGFNYVFKVFLNSNTLNKSFPHHP